MLGHDDFRFVIYDYGSTLAILLLLLMSGRTSGMSGHRAYIASGIVVSIAAAAVQQSGFRLHRHFNHNDLMHVVQMGGVWLLYKGGARLRDAGGTMAVSRREFLKASGLFALQARPASAGVVVNDIHSQLNPTRVREVVAVRVRVRPSARPAAGRSTGHAISIAGGRHAMGAQQFAEQSVMLDMTRFNRVRSFDRARGIVEVEAGIMWPALVDYLLKAQRGARPARKRGASRRSKRARIA